MENFLEPSPTNKDVACFRSVRGRGAGAWLQAIPTDETLALEPGKFRLAASLRLGAQLPFEDWGLVCNCGKDVDNYHLLTCKMGGGPVWEHDEIVAGWSSCLHELNLHHKKEVRYWYVDNEKRLDIVVFDSGAGSSIDLDIALSHPWSQEAMKGSATTDGYAATLIREDQKRAKYERKEYTAVLIAWYLLL